jgi:hypothetical protein
MFKRKGCVEERHITFDVNVVDAAAMHIRKNGSYVLELDYNMPKEVIDKTLRQLKETTGAKWIVIQGGLHVRKGCQCSI